MINQIHFYRVLVCFLILFPLTVSGQKGLKSFLEEKVDEKVDSVLSKNDSTDTFSVVIDSSTTDSTNLPLQEVADKNAILFDTLDFKERNFSVKSRKPNAEYSNENGWQKAFLITNNESYKKKHVLDSSVTVFGWHPYWMGNAYQSYNFSLLNAVAYFSYELNPKTGSYKTIHEWKTTALVDSAKKHGTKVLLSVTNFGGGNNAAFLSNVSAQKTFINTLITLLRERNGDGVNIDFEGIPAFCRTRLTNFIIDLSTSLKAADNEYLVTIALPAVDFDGVYEMNHLNDYVDLFVIMGYEFYGANSGVAGPVAPLTSGKTWWPYNLDRAVSEYLVTGISSKKLLLGLPYYGAEWQTSDLKFPSKAEKFLGYSMYRNIRRDHGKITCCQDEISASKFYVYRDSRNNYRQLWFEDDSSLGVKYDYIKDKKIGGVGIWALGYDNGYTELWKLLADKFAIKDSLILASTQATKSSNRVKSRFSFRYLMSMGLRMARNPKTMLTNPRPLMVLFGGIFGLSLTGIFVLIRYGYRFKRIYKIVLQGGVSLLAISLLAIIFLTMKYAGFREVAFLLGGFLIAGVLFFFFTRRFLIERDLP